MKTKLTQHLEDLGACAPAIEFAAGKTAKETWDNCVRPDWLLWWAARTNTNDARAIVRCAVIAARKVLPLVVAGEDRPRLAIEAAEKWVDTPTPDNAKAARAAAEAAWAAAWAAATAAEAAEVAWAARPARADWRTDVSVARWEARVSAGWLGLNCGEGAEFARSRRGRRGRRATAAAAGEKFNIELCEAIRGQLVLPWGEK